MTRILGMIVVVGLLSESAWAVDASALYDKKCKSCHSLGGVAGPMEGRRTARWCRVEA